METSLFRSVFVVILLMILVVSHACTSDSAGARPAPSPQEERVIRAAEEWWVNRGWGKPHKVFISEKRAAFWIVDIQMGEHQDELHGNNAVKVDPQTLAILGMMKVQ